MTVMCLALAEVKTCPDDSETTTCATQLAAVAAAVADVNNTKAAADNTKAMNATNVAA